MILNLVSHKNSRKLILFILFVKLRKLRFRAVNLSRATKLVSSVLRSEPEDLLLSTCSFAQSTLYYCSCINPKIVRKTPYIM